MDGQLRETTILLLGVDLQGLSRIAGFVNDSLKGDDLDWRPGYQHAENFKSAVGLLDMGFSPNVIYIERGVMVDDGELRGGCDWLCNVLLGLKKEPWFVIEDEALAFLVPILEAKGFKVFSATLVGVVNDEEEARAEAA